MEAAPAPEPPVCPACTAELVGTPTQCPICHHNLSTSANVAGTPEANSRTCGSCGFAATSGETTECPSCKGYRLLTPGEFRSRGGLLSLAGGMICVTVIIVAIYVANAAAQPPPDLGPYISRRTDLDPLRPGAGTKFFLVVSAVTFLASGIAIILGGLKQQATGQPAMPKLKPYLYAMWALGIIAGIINRS